MRGFFLVLLWLALPAMAKTYTDLLGRSVDVAKSERIVCIGPGALRLAVYLRLGARLAGIERIERRLAALAPYSMKLGAARIASLPVIGEGGPGKLPDMEALVRARPDVIFAAFTGRDQAARIEAKTGIPVVALSYGGGYGGGASESKLDGVGRSLLLMGAITGETARARALVAFMDAQAKVLSGALKPPVPSVYVGGIGYKGARGITSTERDYPPFTLLGLQNAVVPGTLPGHVEVQDEALLKADPDVIFLDLGGRGILSERLKTKASFFHALKAYRTRRMFWLLPYNLYSTNIENVFADAWIIAQRLGAKADARSASEKVYRTFLGKAGTAIFAASWPLPELR
jgi:iron complex transport system substrate-binding protein